MSRCTNHGRPSGLAGLAAVAVLCSLFVLGCGGKKGGVHPELLGLWCADPAQPGGDFIGAEWLRFTDDRGADFSNARPWRAYYCQPRKRDQPVSGQYRTRFEYKTQSEYKRSREERQKDDRLLLLLDYTFCSADKLPPDLGRDFREVENSYGLHDPNTLVFERTGIEHRFLRSADGETCP